MSKQNLISIVLSFIPVAYILGTFILNLNILLLILIGLFLYAKGYRYKMELLDKLIILFFIYILFIVYDPNHANYIKKQVEYESFKGLFTS